MSLKERMDAAVAKQEQQNAANKLARRAGLDQAKGRYAEERDEIRARRAAADAATDAQAAERAENRQQLQEQIDQRKAERPTWDRKLAKFEGVTLRKRSIGRGLADTQPLTGVHASIESGEALSRRTTATRVVAGAVLAGPVGAVVGAVAKKKTGGDSYLVITGPEFEWQIEVDRKHADKARQFAAQINTAAKQIDAQ